MSFLCNTDEIKNGESKSLYHGEESYVAVRFDGVVHVYHNRCPHLGVELNWQENKFLDFDGAMIQCFTHGALFTIESGECVAGPCVGEALQRVTVEEREGELHLVES